MPCVGVDGGAAGGDVCASCVCRVPGAGRDRWRSDSDGSSDGGAGGSGDDKRAVVGACCHGTGPGVAMGSAGVVCGCGVVRGATACGVDGGVAVAEYSDLGCDGGVAAGVR